MTHEIRQPLAVISMNGSAALTFLRQVPPKLSEVRGCIEMMTAECYRAADVMEGIRNLFRKYTSPGRPIDLNELVLDVVQMQQEKLRQGRAEARVELAQLLPPVRGHKAQLQEVVINLVNNAVEAMNTATDRKRLLIAKTERRGSDMVAVEIRDTGPGVDPTRAGQIFDAFVTTKSDGRGLGLAICRMIIDQHGGELTVSSDEKTGAVFQFILPIMDSESATAMREGSGRRPRRWKFGL